MNTEIEKAIQEYKEAREKIEKHFKMISRLKAALKKREDQTHILNLNAGVAEQFLLKMVRDS
jgi:hypothetical protein